MKIASQISLALVFAALLVAHAGGARQGKLNVIATTEDLASIAREIGGDRIAVDSIAKGYQDPHFVEAKPSFILKLQKADVLMCVGRELEIGWLPPLIQQSRNAKIQVGRRRVSRCVAAGADPRDPDRQHDARDGRRASAGQSALLDGSGERQAHRQGDRRQAVGDAARTTRRSSSSS